MIHPNKAGSACAWLLLWRYRAGSQYFQDRSLVWNIIQKKIIRCKMSMNIVRNQLKPFLYGITPTGAKAGPDEIRCYRKWAG